MGALLIANVAVIFFGTLVSVAYVFLYGFTAKWWKTFIGQQHLAISALLAVLYIRSTILNVLNWNSTTPPRIFTFVLAALVTAAVTWGFVNYIKLQYWKRNDVK
jgi:hypothetical protein